MFIFIYLYAFLQLRTCSVFVTMPQQFQWDRASLLSGIKYQTQLHTPHSVGHPWTSDKPEIETFRRPTPLTAWPMGSARTSINGSKYINDPLPPEAGHR